MVLENDFTLLDQFAEGREIAFERLVVRHQKVIYYMVLRIVGNHEDAADITQQSFIKAITELKNFKRRSSFRTWLCRIAINLSRNHVKSSSRKMMVPLTERVCDEGENSSDLMIKRERDRMVRQAISGLPERQRLTLILRTYHKMAHREIAEVLDITENNSRANYFHALKNLKSELSGKGGIDEM